MRVLVPFLKIKNALSYYWFWAYCYEEGVLCKWCLQMSVNLVKLAIKVCQSNVFIFKSKKQTGYEINITK